MVKNVIKSIAPPLIISLIIATALFVPHVAAFSGTVQSGADAARGNNQTADLFGSTGIFRTITNVLLYVLGAISVIMIIIGGLRYVVSGGNSANVTAAKNTILYAIVGVVIALLAYAIINFVLGSFSGGSSSSVGGSSYSV